MSKMIALSAARAAAMGINVGVGPIAKSKSTSTGVSGGVINETNAPAFQVNETFFFQSYFDSALAEKALLRQAQNDPIVKSTLSQPLQIPGYGLALHPSSECPVAVQFETGAQQGASQAFTLKPGQLIWPNGRPDGTGHGAQFSGFQWGLPFGWLGGGSATLVVLRTADATVNWAADHNEIVYHRIRLKIWDPADVEFPAAAGVYTGALNWPQRFPWPGAVYGSNSLSQGGKPSLVVMPTRTALSLRLATVTLGAAPDDGVFRMNWVGADAWAQGLTGTISLADVRGTDQVWGTWAQQAGAPAPFNSVFQTLLLHGEAERYGANAGALLLSSLDPQLQDAFVDIVRYGRL